MHAVFIIFGIALLAIPMIWFQLICKALSPRFSEKIPYYFHKILLKFLGIKVTIKGKKLDNIPLLITSNHISWIDIPVIGSSFYCYFIAKSEISSWPIFGFLAKLQNTIFVNRSAKGKDIQNQVDDIEKALINNKTVILFPEGTTSDGNKVLPFKSALMSLSQTKDGKAVTIQPMIIKYTQFSGMPLGRFEKPYVAWYGSTDLIPHLFTLLECPPIDVELIIGEPLSPEQFTNRKELAKHLENCVRLSYTQH
jgi:1-acyl-sn-glycerol-3-phosphate acyltransferase